MFKDYICPNCEKSLQIIFDAMNVGYAIQEIIRDGQGKPIDYRFLEINQVCARILGFSKDKIIGMTVNDIEPFFMETYRRVAPTGQPTKFEYYSKFVDRYFNVNLFFPNKNQFITLFTDITKLKKTEQVLEKSKLLVDAAHDAIFYLKDDGAIIDANRAAVLLYGFEDEELLKMKIQDIRHSSTLEQFEGEMRQADAAGVTFDCVHVKKDGSQFPVEVSARSTMIGNERIRIHIIRDISERKEKEDKINYLARYDALTGIPNRAYLMSELEKVMGTANRAGHRVALMLFDIDKFKFINDTYGHAIGDIVLATIAQKVKETIRKVDIVGRLGGDEFVIINPLFHQNDDSLKLIDRIFEMLEKPLAINGYQLKIAISIGISVFPDDTKSMEELLSFADKAMYEAKKQSGCSFSVFQNRINEI